MAGENLKNLNLELKASKNLEEVQERLLELEKKRTKVAKEEREELKKKEKAILDYIVKLKAAKDTAKEVTTSFKEMTESMSLSSRSSANVTKFLSQANKNFRGIVNEGLKFADKGIDKGFETANQISDVASKFLEAQQNILNAGADLTVDEATELSTKLNDASKEYQSIITSNQEFLKSQGQLNNFVADLNSSFNSINKELQITQGLTSDEIDQYKELTAEGERLRTKFKSVGDMITTALKKPAVLLGLAVIAIGRAVSKLGENFREFGGNLGGAVFSATALSLVFKEGTNVAKGLASEFGSMEDISFMTQLNTNLMAVNLGITGDEAAKLVGGFARLNNGSIDVANNMIATTKAMSEAAGLNTAAVTADIAANMGKFVEFSNDGGENLQKAAIVAAQLGVNLGTVSSVADSLLDFETSITKELELGALLGRNINLNKARTLFFDGKSGEAVKETLRALGGVAVYNDMDVISKRQTAALLGISGDELNRMVNNMDKLNADGTVQVSKFDSMNEALTAMTTGPFGALISGMGALIMLTLQTGLQWAMIRRGIDRATASLGRMNAVQNAGNVTSTLGGAPGPMNRSGTPDRRFKANRLPATPPPSPGAGGMSFLDKIGSPGQILSLAVALLAFGGAVFVIAKAFEVFGNVTNMGQALIGFGAAIIGMGLSIGLLSTILAPLASTGILQLVALGFITFGAAVALVGLGIKLTAEGFALFASSLGVLATNIPPLFAMLPQLFSLAAAFTALGLSLALVGTLGLAGVGVLLAAGVAATGLAMIMGDSGETSGVEGGSLEQTVKDGLQNVVDAINKKSFDVYLDKSKVTNMIFAEEKSKTRNNVKIT